MEVGNGQNQSQRLRNQSLSQMVTGNRPRRQESDPIPLNGDRIKSAEEAQRLTKLSHANCTGLEGMMDPMLGYSG